MLSLNTLSVFVTLAALCLIVVYGDSDITAIFPEILKSERDSFHEPCDDTREQLEFDFVIVGAGPAGCALANRLTEEDNWDVLLLEAGGEETEIMDIPNVYSGFFQENFWHYKTLRSETGYKSFVDQQATYLTGKVMGGGTSVNYMIAVRGSRHSYDEWDRMGNPGWGYNDVLPYFKKLENIQIPELRDNEQYHSTEGNIKISYSPYRSELSSVFIQAGKQLGYSEIDYNGENQTGFALLQTTTADGSRWSASRGYLHPIRDRPNLYVKKHAMVTKILINKTTNTAYGVHFMKGGNNFTAIAKKEVILSAGAIKSPQLLMVSGIGPKEQLEALGINVIKNSKVGMNSIDHPFFLGLIFTINEKIGPTKAEMLANPKNFFDYFVNKKGPLTSNMFISGICYLDLEDAPDYFPGWPSVGAPICSPHVTEDIASALGLGFTQDVFEQFFSPLVNLSTIQLVPFITKPKSRGKIIIQDGNIFTPPVYDANLLSEEDDILTMISGIREIIKLIETPQFQRLGAKLHDIPLPACKDIEFNTDEYWRCAVLQMSLPGYHASGTCKMGPATDDSSVVDSECKVHGVNNLRVCDTSIFPTMPASNTMLPAYMVGEKVADMIKRDHIV